MKTKVFLVLLCALLLLGVAGRSSARAQSSVVVQGIAFCRYHQSVGVWVASTNSGSGFATVSKVSGDGHIVSFYKTSMSVPAMMSVHVGCDGTTQHWESDNRTQDIGVDKDMVLKVYCDDLQSGTTHNCRFVPSAEAAAIDWGAKKLGYGQEYAGKCLTFVSDAYKFSAAGIDVVARGWIMLRTDRWTYPYDIWGHFHHGQIGTDTNNKQPPAGAWVFFMPNDGKSYWNSHVELSLGGGTMLSTKDGYGDNNGYGATIHTETIDQHDKGAYNHYVGWWLPDM